MTADLFRIRRGVPRDAEQLAEFAARTFSDTFAAANRPEDIAAYLPSAYSVSHQASELNNPDIITLIMESNDGQWSAYAMLRRSVAPECVSGDHPIEIWRFYVDRPWHGFGLAQRLMTAVEETAREETARTLWLGVWERNDRAIAFYAKCGFSDVGAQHFWVGSDKQTDRIMVRHLQQLQQAR
jgi:GNAT superfamily N-acetyltransferase